MSVREESEESGGLATKLIELLVGILEDPKFQPDRAPDITDAALLMAADGYGKGKVVGEADGEETIIRTSETQKSFLFAKEPAPEELAHEADRHFARVVVERDMNH